MHIADLDSVLRIEEAVYPTPLTRLGYVNELTRNQHGHYFVLEGAGAQIIGYVGIIYQLDEGHISVISVDPAFQGQRFGELLLVTCLMQMVEADASLATLEVREHNQRAIALYTKYQFVQVGRRKRYYRDTNEDALIMTVEPLDAAYATHLLTAWDRIVTSLA